MEFPQNIPPAIVLGMDIIGLATARNLGKHDIPVVGVAFDRHQSGFLSKYCCKRMICPSPRDSELEFINSLLSLGTQLPARAVLFPTSDELVLSISRNRATLAPYYVFPLPEGDIIESINDKLKFYRLALEHGIDVPTTYYAENLDSLLQVSRRIRYPCIIKPKFGYLLEKFKVKAVNCNKRAELIENFQRMRTLSSDILIQDFVIGKDDQQFSLCSYLNRDFEPLAIFTSRKIRQRPTVFGVGTLVESCYIPEIIELGIPFLKKLMYWGISEMEFRKDARDGKFKVLEINTRPWDQIGLPAKCGINFLLIAYNDLLGRKIDRVNSFKRNVKWLRFRSDFCTSFGKSGYVSKGELTLREWLKSIRGEKEYVIFAWDDITPFVFSSLRGGTGLFRKIISKLLKGKSKTNRNSNF